MPFVLKLYCIQNSGVTASWILWNFEDHKNVFHQNDKDGHNWRETLNKVLETRVIGHPWGTNYSNIKKYAQFHTFINVYVYKHHWVHTRNSRFKNNCLFFKEKCSRNYIFLIWNVIQFASKYFFAHSLSPKALRYIQCSKQNRLLHSLNNLDKHVSPYDTILDTFALLISIGHCISYIALFILLLVLWPVWYSS